jgi:YgiT-type zinc finger domain-containing protein
LKCVICKHGETSIKPVTVTLERDGSTLVVKSVPAEVCDDHGEQYVDATAASNLLREASKAADAGIEVAVRKFVA